MPRRGHRRLASGTGRPVAARCPGGVRSPPADTSILWHTLGEAGVPARRVHANGARADARGRFRYGAAFGLAPAPVPESGDGDAGLRAELVERPAPAACRASRGRPADLGPAGIGGFRPARGASAGRGDGLATPSSVSRLEGSSHRSGSWWWGRAAGRWSGGGWRACPLGGSVGKVVAPGSGGSGCLPEERLPGR